MNLQQLYTVRFLFFFLQFIKCLLPSVSSGVGLVNKSALSDWGRCRVKVQNHYTQLSVFTSDNSKGKWLTPGQCKVSHTTLHTSHGSAVTPLCSCRRFQITATHQSCLSLHPLLVLLSNRSLSCAIPEMLLSLSTSSYRPSSLGGEAQTHLCPAAAISSSRGDTEVLPGQQRETWSLQDVLHLTIHVSWNSCPEGNREKIWFPPLPFCEIVIQFCQANHYVVRLSRWKIPSNKTKLKWVKYPEMVFLIKRLNDSLINHLV